MNPSFHQLPGNNVFNQHAPLGHLGRRPMGNYGNMHPRHRPLDYGNMHMGLGPLDYGNMHQGLGLNYNRGPIHEWDPSVESNNMRLRGSDSFLRSLAGLEAFFSTQAPGPHGTTQTPRNERRGTQTPRSQSTTQTPRTGTPRTTAQMYMTTKPRESGGYRESSYYVGYSYSSSSDWMIPVFCSIGGVLLICLCVYMYLRRKRRLAKESSRTVLVPQQGSIVTNSNPIINRYPVFEDMTPSAPPLI